MLYPASHNLGLDIKHLWKFILDTRAGRISAAFEDMLHNWCFIFHKMLFICHHLIVFCLNNTHIFLKPGCLKVACL